MSKDLTKKAVEMLLSGATLVSDPCPYCKGVRVMKNGNALCVSCGRQAKDEVESTMTTEKPGGNAIDNLDQKLKDLTVELQSEKDFEKQKQILHTMNEILAIKEKLG
ncbi:MAG TPA: autoantigen p27 domain-containing protein, partial [Candidatus Nitrosotalea sp.]|nr:autoantigen p27 domain-containing protein [Candidatus Nitrosotalea sp.]